MYRFATVRAVCRHAQCAGLHSRSRSLSARGPIARFFACFIRNVTVESLSGLGLRHHQLPSEPGGYKAAIRSPLASRKGRFEAENRGESPLTFMGFFDVQRASEPRPEGPSSVGTGVPIAAVGMCRMRAKPGTRINANNSRYREEMIFLIRSCPLTEEPRTQGSAHLSDRLLPFVFLIGEVWIIV